MTNINPENNTEYTATGVVYNDEARFHAPTKKEPDASRLHEFADHDGYSDYSMPVRL